MRRAVAVLVAALGLVTVAAAPAQAAAYRPGCASSSARWSITATNLRLQVATLHVTQTRCWNRAGLLTGTSVDEWTVDTSGGSAFGVLFDHGSDYRLHRDSGMQEWGRDWAMRACFAQWSLWCGPTMDWRIVVVTTAPVLHGWIWHDPFCLTRACVDHVRFRRTG